jgi:hypothetical protein
MGSSIAVYLSRIIPFLSLLGVCIVLFVSFAVEPYRQNIREEEHGKSTTIQLVLSAYTIFLHVLSVLFPARVCWSIGDVIKKMEESAALTKWPKKRQTQAVKNGQGTTSYPTPTFVIIIPAYKEEMATLEETLMVLGSHVQARHSYHVRSDSVAAVDGVSVWRCCRILDDEVWTLINLGLPCHGAERRRLYSKGGDSGQSVQDIFLPNELYCSPIWHPRGGAGQEQQ